MPFDLYKMFFDRKKKARESEVALSRSLLFIKERRAKQAESSQIFWYSSEYQAA